jgi:MarR family transcriptional regulator for hemolysin
MLAAYKMSKTPNSNVIQKLGLASYDMSTSINLAQRAFRELLRTCLSHHGLTIPQWTLLGKLYKSGQIRPVHVAKLLNIKPPYIAKLLNELEKDKIIQTVEFADDGRGKAICLTKKGKELVEYVETQLASCLNEQFGELQPDDLKVYFFLTQYIATNIRHKN